MKQFIGKYLSQYYNYVLITGEDEEDARLKLNAFLVLNNIEHIPLSVNLVPITASIK